MRDFWICRVVSSAYRMQESNSTVAWLVKSSKCDFSKFWESMKLHLTSQGICITIFDVMDTASKMEGHEEGHEEVTTILFVLACHNYDYTKYTLAYMYDMSFGGKFISFIQYFWDWEAQNPQKTDGPKTLTQESKFWTWFLKAKQRESSDLLQVPEHRGIALTRIFLPDFDCQHLTSQEFGKKQKWLSRCSRDYTQKLACEVFNHVNFKDSAVGRLTLESSISRPSIFDQLRSIVILTFLPQFQPKQFYRNSDIWDASP